jgi:hypothetical protein
MCVLCAVYLCSLRSVSRSTANLLYLSQLVIDGWKLYSIEQQSHLRFAKLVPSCTVHICG